MKRVEEMLDVRSGMMGCAMPLIVLIVVAALGAVAAAGWCPIDAAPEAWAARTAQTR